MVVVIAEAKESTQQVKRAKPVEAVRALLVSLYRWYAFVMLVQSTLRLHLYV